MFLRFLSPLLRRAGRTPQDVAETSKAYKQVFRSPSGAFVFNDLAQFCRAYQPTFDKDPRLSAVLEGRREVILRIMQYMELSDQELIDLAAGKFPISDQPK